MKKFEFSIGFLAGLTALSIAQAASLQLDSRTSESIKEAVDEESYKITAEEKARREYILKEDLFDAPAALLPVMTKGAPSRCRMVDSRGRCQI